MTRMVKANFASIDVSVFRLIHAPVLAILVAFMAMVCASCKDNDSSAELGNNLRLKSAVALEHSKPEASRTLCVTINGSLTPLERRASRAVIDWLKRQLTEDLDR